jgi:hypothetical protein
MEDFEQITEIKSRLQYVTDPKAQDIWNFLVPYLSWDGYKVTVPAFRVLDALSMINQDRIAYSEG